MSRNTSKNKKRHKQALRQAAAEKRANQSVIKYQRSKTYQSALHERFSNAAFILGKAVRRVMPDDYNDTIDVPRGVRDLGIFSMPHGIAQTQAFKRGISDLTGMTWASLTQPTLNALDTLNPEQLACFIGFMAARTRHILKRENAMPEGMDANIRHVEDTLFAFYDRYPVYRLPPGFNAQTYSLALQILKIDDGRANAAANSARSNGYFHDVLDLKKIEGDADLLDATMNDGNAFAHLLSRHFKLTQEQQEAFALLVHINPNLSRQEDPALKDEDGKYKHSVEDVRKPAAPPAKIKDTFDPNQIARDADLRYAALNTSLDEITDIADIVNLSEGRAIHEEMVKQNPVLMRSTTRIANHLRQRLQTQHMRHVQRHLEEGLLDASTLPALIADPSLTDTFFQVQEGLGQDTVVTLLVDNSASMSGEKIRLAYAATRLFSIALERAQIPYEVLGFTTVNGEHMDVEYGRMHPLRQIVYKSYNDRQARPERLSGMLCESMLGGTPTSECLLWAAKRLSMRPEKRKILISMEDGQPAMIMKGHSQSMFPNLETSKRHMVAVVNALEARGDIQLGAIGIMQDVSRYYSNSVKIDQSEQLPQILASLLDKILVQRQDFNPALFKALKREMKPKGKVELPLDALIPY